MKGRDFITLLGAARRPFGGNATYVGQPECDVTSASCEFRTTKESRA
jgi:hypothetical protein